MIDDEFGIFWGWRVVVHTCVFLVPLLCLEKWGSLQLAKTTNTTAVSHEMLQETQRIKTITMHLHFCNAKTQSTRHHHHQETLNEESTLEKGSQWCLSLFLLGLLLHWKAHQNKRSTRIPYQVHLGLLLEPAGGQFEKKRPRPGAQKLRLGQVPSFVGLFQLQLIIPSNALSKAILTRSDQIFAHSQKKYSRLDALLDVGLIWHGNALKATSGKDTHT